VKIDWITYPATLRKEHQGRKAFNVVSLTGGPELHAVNLHIKRYTTQRLGFQHVLKDIMNKYKQHSFHWGKDNVIFIFDANITISNIQKVYKVFWRGKLSLYFQHMVHFQKYLYHASLRSFWKYLYIVSSRYF